MSPTVLNSFFYITSFFYIIFLLQAARLLPSPHTYVGPTFWLVLRKAEVTARLLLVRLSDDSCPNALPCKLGVYCLIIPNSATTRMRIYCPCTPPLSWYLLAKTTSAGLSFWTSFNNVDRQTMFQEFRRHLPSMSPWVESCYSDRPLLHLGNNSCCGVQQGDPLGPLALLSHSIQS